MSKRIVMASMAMLMAFMANAQENEVKPQKQETMKTQEGKEYQLKTGKIGESVAKGYKAIENGVVSGYKAIENGVVNGYKAIENGVVEGYKKIENKFVATFLEEKSNPEGEQTN